MDRIGAPIPVEITPEIIDLARWAVDEHNKKQNSNLEFKKVLSAKKQEVAVGFKYYVMLEMAGEVGRNNIYEAIVLEKAAGENNVNVKQLLEFNRIVRA